MKYVFRNQMVRFFLFTFLTCFLIGCATYREQKSLDLTIGGDTEEKAMHTFYIAGGLGNLKEGKKELVLNLLKDQLEKAPENSTMIFTGDNLSPKEDQWEFDKKRIEQQIGITDNFKGKTIFMPGDFEWKSFDADKMEKVEDLIKDKDIERLNVFPENACPLERIVLNDQLDMILIDSYWFVSNWDRVKGINRKCTDIVTRRRFVEELEGMINDGQDKNIVIAMHHPIFSNGIFAGKETFSDQLTPLPVLGTVFNRIEDWAGFSNKELNSRRYNYLRIMVSALAQDSDRITLVSGHEESLQYLTGGGIHQIVSGSLGGKTATRRSEDEIITIGGSLDYKGLYTYGEPGFAKLEYFKDGSSKVTFITQDSDSASRSFAVLPKFEEKPKIDIPEGTTKKYVQASVLDGEQKKNLEKTGFYEFIWGDRYREYFGKEVTAKVVSLDTLYGGLKVTQEGGGHQSFSLRLEDKNGKEYAMRSLRKNALKFLKFKVKGIAYEAEDYKGTLTEEVISDFFTTAHPYIQLAISPMARKVDVNHASPELFYVPKQKSLGDLNATYGDELYYIEERPSDMHKNYVGYNQANPEKSGRIPDFESTTDVLEKLKRDESYDVEQRSFVRARIFDMLIGDWDRHQDQWRWAEYELESGDKRFLPIPRDRDGAFTKFDGVAFPIIKWFVPKARFWQSYGEDLNDVPWFMAQGNSLDRAFVTKFGADVWTEEAEFIQQQLTKEVIDAAFLRLPKEVQDSTSQGIKNSLIGRLANLKEMATEYGQYLNKVVALHGTEKDDQITVTRLPEGKTKVVIRRLLSDEPNEVMFDRTFDRAETKELWIYGLGDKDEFIVEGDGDGGVFVRLVGGYGKDTYKISNKKALKVYDWKSEESEFEDKVPSKQLTNSYETNTFHWRQFTENTNMLLPNVGFRTDDGLYLGATNVYTNNGFNGNPFRQKHTIAANYYFKFEGVELSYQGIFANIIPKWNFEVDGYFTNDRFSNNYFGMGNETFNPDDQLDNDYNRARMRQVQLNAGIAYRTLKIKGLYESFKVSENENRFFTPDNVDPNVFDSQDYVGAEVSVAYDHDDADDFPTKAIYMGLTGGYKTNLNLEDNSFAYAGIKFGFSQKVIPSGNLVLGTMAEYKTNFGDDFFFYHAPSIGGNNGLRGFRNERFTGKSYFYQSSDLRLRLKRIVTAVAPITIGMYGGFDYGRVWMDNDTSNQWHTSQGGGLWISGYRFLAFNLGFFNSVEGNMVQVGFGFGF
ncbi:ShlB/FhaC/HecB family hemolysin secretion/activation protein [Sediminicola luteus]|uniref:Haemolysin activator HlyB C-terminal domain-containing protein n=1 Tax=Sediminicola luteus TaxID=319238 RepID=A0ABV2TYT0_9FLAO